MTILTIPTSEEAKQRFINLDNLYRNQLETPITQENINLLNDILERRNSTARVYRRVSK